MEWKGPAVITASLSQLTVQRFRADADAHGGDFNALLQHVVPEENIAVEIPVVVVGGAASVGLAAFEFAADALDEDGFLLGTDAVFTLFGGELRPAILQLLGGDEGHVPA